MEFNVDLHCHPSIKPFGQSFPGNKNSWDPGKKSSIWHDDPPGFFDKIIRLAPTFSQSNFTALYNGKIMVVIAALNPIEKGFLTTNIGTGDVADSAYNYVTEIGKEKVDFIQSNKDDYSELQHEYKFYKRLHNHKIRLNGVNVCYRMTKKYRDIERNLNAGQIISVIISIEGAYTFNSNNTHTPGIHMLRKHINQIKHWRYPPLFVTFCHHFFNFLGGHARSFPAGIVSREINQSAGVDTNLNDKGKKSIRMLLSRRNGKRILIDVKHMSRESRISYYDMLDDEYSQEDIPIIVSHGAVNGFPLVGDFSQGSVEENGRLHGRDINFYDDEIVRIAKSHGIFGIQIDKRQITSKTEIREIRRHSFLNHKKRLRMYTELVWNQIQYIADLLDSNRLFAWDITCIGTDYDGIIAPFEGYWTSADIPTLRTNLHEFAKQYLEHKEFTIDENLIDPCEVLARVFSDNAMNFFAKYYI